MIQRIRVELLGGLSVWADDVPVVAGASKINKPWQLFCFLVLNRARPSVPTRLISVLWPEESLSDPGNVLKNTIYALRREFKNVDDTDESPILFENGAYICNPNIAFEVDVDAFEEACRQAFEADGGARLQMLQRAAGLYKGELLPQLGDEIWVMPLALYYKKRFSECMGSLCSALYSSKKYSELLAAATEANNVDMTEEEYYMYIFRALYELGMYRVIVPTYQKTQRIFAEELGIPMNQEIKVIYEAACEKVDVLEQDIMIIKDDLRDAVQGGVSAKGPMYCTYDVFKYLYQMLSRSSERSGNNIVIILVTLGGPEGEHLPAKVLSTAMHRVKARLMDGLLRRSDTLARYSKSQYIIMLSMEYARNTQAVIERIRKRCEPLLEADGVKMLITTADIEPKG